MSGAVPLSVAIIARDEATHIGAALASVAALADEMLVLLDDRTTDRTAAICEAAGAQVVTEPWRGFSAQRNRALELCRNEWVLFLDADERVEAALADEIRALLATPSLVDGYWIPRHNQFFGAILRGGGWYPDHQLRLLRRTAAHYDPARVVHEVAEITGDTARLNGHLLHINIERMGELLAKQRAYALHEAQIMHQSGRHSRWRNFVGAPAREFYRRYVQLGGWRDGRVGLLMCATLATFETVKFTHLKGLERL